MDLLNFVRKMYGLNMFDKVTIIHDESEFTVDLDKIKEDPRCLIVNLKPYGLSILSRVLSFDYDFSIIQGLLKVYL